MPFLLCKFDINRLPQTVDGIAYLSKAGLDGVQRGNQELNQLTCSAGIIIHCNILYNKHNYLRYNLIY